MSLPLAAADLYTIPRGGIIVNKFFYFFTYFFKLFWWDGLYYNLFMEIRTPIIAILVIGILLLIFLRKNKPELRSSRIFFAFLIVVFFNNLCEIIQDVIFVYLDSSYSVLRRGAQNLYVATLISAAYIISMYIYSKTTKRGNVKGTVFVLDAIPLLVGYGAIIFGKMNYGYTSVGKYYNYGPAVMVCYIIGFLYIVLSLTRVVYMRNRLRKDDYLALLSGLIVWAILASYQFINRDTQVSAAAMMLMGLILFIAIENPKEYYERSLDNVRNRDAFIMTLAEKFGVGNPFFIASVIFTGKTNVMNSADRHELEKLQTEVAEIADKATGATAYLSNWNTISFLVGTPDKVEVLMNLISGQKDRKSQNYKMTFSVLEAPKYTTEVDEALQILSYVSGEYVYSHSSPNIVIDGSVIDKMIFRNTIEDVVRQAIKDKAFDVYYQPILCVADGSFSSAEALVRLRRPDGENYISPEDFIPIAEKCGLILEIDDLVFEKVCSFIAKENLSSYGIKLIEVNLSGNEVVDERTHERLLAKMKKYHIPPKFINFEITETSYISNDEVFQNNVDRLKESGSSFSMDDFGSGYSNLLEILKMDYALVKLDKEFVWNCLDPEKPENMRMLDYTINFLKDYGLHILAEGVENIDQAKILIDKGVEYLQGFYYSRPIPEKEYLEFLHTQKGFFAKEKGDQL